MWEIITVEVDLAKTPETCSSKTALATKTALQRALIRRFLSATMELLRGMILTERLKVFYDFTTACDCLSSDG